MPDKLQDAVVHVLRRTDDANRRKFATEAVIAVMNPVISSAESLNEDSYWEGLVEGLVAEALAISARKILAPYIDSVDDHHLSEYTLRVKDFMERLCQTIADDLKERTTDV